MWPEAELFIKARHPLGESLQWQDEKNRLLWVDLLEPALHMHDFTSGTTTVHPLPLPRPIGSFVLTDDPDVILLCHTKGLSFLNTETRKLTDFCDPEAGRDGIIYNDMKMDRFGRLWVGTSHALEKEPRGALWCVSASGEATLVDAGFAISNGPAFSRDGRTMYFNDSMGYQTLAYDLDAARPGAWNRRVFARYSTEEGNPDGIVVDSENCPWSAQWLGGRLIRLSPGGDKIGEVIVPAPVVATLCFGDHDLQTIYINTAREGMDSTALERHPLSGSIFMARSPVKGLAEPRFPLRRR